MYKCKFCNVEIPNKRVLLGYSDTCTKHSTTNKYYGFTIVSSKDTRDLQVIKSQEVYLEISRLEKTKGRF